jgi:branched-chain amino acid transport system permease protein
MVEALGHNVPRVFMMVFAGGCALAGLAGVLGGNMFITEPGMAFAVGSIVFVVVVFGGMGSLAGAFVASLIIGAIQTFSVALDFSMLSLLDAIGIHVSEESNWYGLWSITISQTAPVLPYLLMVLMLIVRPRGLMGTRES